MFRSTVKWILEGQCALELMFKDDIKVTQTRAFSI